MACSCKSATRQKAAVKQVVKKVAKDESEDIPKKPQIKRTLRRIY